ncbi:hypothetical protein A5646_03255 [Mycobacterium sp. 1245499.0]|uniref:hypothetical protein n=1 Tax=Mycobacterium sp. 1245499.0 TaxID=1834074 RepID=UPI0008021532|nr:hypothetical protein [Mycobacterium sp. 1245499.0]OBK92608.1 hypothetical protein A5646_03255 [Mycobacterium sp. 1245499.0]
MPTIRDLIRSALDSGRSVRDLEQDSGYRVKFQTFQELANHAPRQFPKEIKTITGMAQALNVSETAVVLAYAKGLGIPVEGLNNTFALRLPPDVNSIEPEMQNAIINMARAAVRQRRIEPNPDAPPL